MVSETSIIAPPFSPSTSIYTIIMNCGSQPPPAARKNLHSQARVPALQIRILIRLLYWYRDFSLPIPNSKKSRVLGVPASQAQGRDFRISPPLQILFHLSC